MKGLLIFCIVITVIAAVPLKGKGTRKRYSVKEGARQDAAVLSPSPVTAKAQVPVVVDGVSPSPVAPIEANIESSPTSAPAQAATVPPVDIISTKSIVGSEPAGEGETSNLSPLPLTEAPTVSVPAPVVLPDPEIPVVQAAPTPVAIEAASAPQPAVPVLASEAPAPAVTAPPQPIIVLAPGTEIVPAVAVDNSTKKPESEEEDSSSEEEADEEVDGDGRQLAISSSSEERPAGVSTKEIVINAYATPTGQVLVPLNVYQKYFHNPQSLPNPLRFVPQGTSWRQDGEQQASGSSEEESDTSGEGEASSEETIPIQVSPTSVIFQQKGKPANETSDNPNLAEAESEGEDTTSAPTEDNEDKSNSAESEEKPSAEAVPQQAAPPAFFSPQTLGSVPATRPTDEDDEREAGRYGFPYYEFPQEGAYADDFFQGNYYRVDPEFGGYEY